MSSLPLRMSLKHMVWASSFNSDLFHHLISQLLQHLFFLALMNVVAIQLCPDATTTMVPSARHFSCVTLHSASFPMASSAPPHQRRAAALPFEDPSRHPLFPIHFHHAGVCLVWTSTLNICLLKSPSLSGVEHRSSKHIAIGLLQPKNTCDFAKRCATWRPICANSGEPSENFTFLRRLYSTWALQVLCNLYLWWDRLTLWQSCRSWGLLWFSWIVIRCLFRT